MKKPFRKVITCGSVMLLVDQAEVMKGKILYDNLTMLSLDSRSGCLFGLALTGELLAITMASNERVAAIVEAEVEGANPWLIFPGVVRMDGRPVRLDPRVVALMAEHKGIGKAAGQSIKKTQTGFTFSALAKSGDEVHIVQVHNLSYIIFDYGGETLVGELTFADDGTWFVGERIGAVDPDDHRALMEVDSDFLSDLGYGWQPVPGPGLDRLVD